MVFSLLGMENNNRSRILLETADLFRIRNSEFGITQPPGLSLLPVHPASSIMNRTSVEFNEAGHISKWVLCRSDWDGRSLRYDAAGRATAGLYAGKTVEVIESPHDAFVGVVDSPNCQEVFKVVVVEAEIEIEEGARNVFG